MRVLVTGASGFIGHALCNRLAAQGVQLIGAFRNTEGLDSSLANLVSMPCINIGDINQFTNWSPTIQGVDFIVHLAARVHIMNDSTSDPLAAFREINTGGTLNLARQAAVSGVKRFIFVSSVKVNGEHTVLGQPFHSNDSPIPKDPYAISKREAEEGLHEIAMQTGMEVAIVRPPLVYGPGVKANFATMMRWIARGLPMPFGAVINNRRSFIALDNLVDLLITCLDHPAAANQTFLASDDEDISTADLLYRLAIAMDKPARLFPVPLALLQTGASLLGKGDVAQRVLGNLQVDITHTKKTLGWVPPLSLNEGLWRAARDIR